jgi:hypothetical protein
MARRFDRIDLTTHLKAFLCQLDIPNKTRFKTLEMHGNPCRSLVVRIKFKTRCCDRVDLITYVNAIVCQSYNLNKMGLKTL